MSRHWEDGRMVVENCKSNACKEDVLGVQACGFVGHGDGSGLVVGAETG